MKGPRFAVARGRPGPDGARPVIRLERENDEVIVSPPLGGVGLCEPCWLRRRAATVDPLELSSHPGAGDGLIDAFERRAGVSGRRCTSGQRAALTRVLRVGIAEAREPPRGTGPARLARIDASGKVRHESVLPMPDCTTCRLDDACAAPSLNHLLGRAAGIVCDLQEVPARPGEPSFPRVAVVALANSWLRRDWAFGTGASGKGESIEAAVGSAVGEAMERYAANALTIPPRLGRLTEADGAILPRRLDGTARHGAAGTDEAMAWIEARPIHPGGAARWLPASAVYLRWLDAWGPSRPTMPTSNGLAAAPDLATAVERAFAEVIERHLFFLVWYGARDAEEPAARALIDPDTLGAFEAAALEVRALILGRAAGIVAAAACCWPTSPTPGRPGFALGLGTDRSPGGAVRAAVLELGQVYRGLTWALADPSLADRACRLAAGTVDVETPFDHGLLHAARTPEAVPSPFGTAARRVRPTFVGAQGDPQAYFIDLTPRDVAAATGWRIARVVAPDVVPYHVGRARFPDDLFRFGGREELRDVDLHPLN